MNFVTEDNLNAACCHVLYSEVKIPRSLPILEAWIFQAVQRFKMAEIFFNLSFMFQVYHTNLAQGTSYSWLYAGYPHTFHFSMGNSFQMCKKNLLHDIIYVIPFRIS